MRLRALFSSTPRAYSPPTEAEVMEALTHVVQAAHISGLSITPHRLSFILESEAEHAQALEATCRQALTPLAPADYIHIICTNPSSANTQSPSSSQEEITMHHASVNSATARHEVRGVRGGGTPPEETQSPTAKRALYNTNPIPHVGRIIAIASGKGGVGKSSLTLLVAHALAATGRSVAIVDADIHGPSVPRMLGLAGTPPEVRDGLMIPATSHGIMANSIGLIAGETAAIWRGPMVSKALVQLLRGTNWQNPHEANNNSRDRGAAKRGGVNREAREGGDPVRGCAQRNTSLAPSASNASYANNHDDADGYVSQGETTLLIDLPPGTGDIQLSLMQAVPVSAAIIVTTPQEVSRIDAHKAATMFKKLNIPILGVVENMSYLELPDGSRLTPFGAGGGAQLAADFGVPLLAQLPLDPSLGAALDKGENPPEAWFAHAAEIIAHL